jgi:hypothetical protein
MCDTVETDNADSSICFCSLVADTGLAARAAAHATCIATRDPLRSMSQLLTPVAHVNLGPTTLDVSLAIQLHCASRNTDSMS